MALFDNNTLLSTLGGQDYDTDSSQEQLQNLRNFGQAALGSQLPQTMYSPWQGVAYLLDKFQGRNALDSAANIQKQELINKIKGSPLPPGIGGPDTMPAPVNPVSGVQSPGMLKQDTSNVSGQSQNTTGQPSNIYTQAVKGFEGFTPKAKWDYKQNTNGYGTKAEYPGEVIDQQTADDRFNTEWGKASGLVGAFAPNAPEGVKAALTSLTFNAGTKWMNSGLGDAVKKGDYETAKNIFLQYNHAGGEVNQGLVNRRQQEAAWFDSPQQTNVAQNTPTLQAGQAPQEAKPVQVASNGNIETGSLPAQIQQELQSRIQPQAPIAQGQQVAQAQQQGGAPQHFTQAQPQNGQFNNSYEASSHGIQTPLGTLPPPAPAWTQEELYRYSQLPPDAQKTYKEARDTNYTPQWFDTGYGSMWVLPNGMRGFISKPNLQTMKLGEGFEVPVQRSLGPDGQLHTQYAIPGAGQGGAQGNGDNGLQSALNLRTDVAKNTAENKAIEARAVESTKGAVGIQQKPIQEAIDNSGAAKKQIQLLNALDEIDALPASANIHTGPYADKILNWQKTINDVLPGTFNAQQLANAEGIKKLGAQIASTQARELTNRPTQYDFKTFLDAVPGLEVTPQGRKALSSLYRASAQQDIDIGNIANQYADKPEQYQSAVEQYYKDHPITLNLNGKTYKFSAGKPMQVSGGGTNLAPEGTRVRMQDGTTRIKRNGQWVNE